MLVVRCEDLFNEESCTVVIQEGRPGEYVATTSVPGYQVEVGFFSSSPHRFEVIGEAMTALTERISELAGRAQQWT